MRNIVLLIIVSIPGLLSAQILPQYYDTLEYNSVISFMGGIDYAASAVKKDISKSIYAGGFISNEMKDYSFDRHKGVNRIGGEAFGEFSYSNFKVNLFKKKPWGMHITAGSYYFGGAVYGKDLFGLGFYGNERYIGDTIDLSGTDLSFTGFEKIGFGFIDPKSKSSLTFNIYNVNNRFNGDFRDVKIIQSEDSSYIELIMDGDVELKSNLAYNQGFGFGLDFNYYLNIDWQSGKTAYINFSARNVGFAYMYQDQNVYSFDTTFTYSGLTFEQITGDNSILKDSIDILDTLGIKSGVSNPTFILPSYIQIAKIVDEHQKSKVQSFFGIRMYPTLIYAPYVFGGVDYKVNDWLRFGAMMSFGGFTKLKGGFYTGVKKGKFTLGVSSENVLGFVSKKASGESLQINLRCVL